MYLKMNFGLDDISGKIIIFLVQSLFWKINYLAVKISLFVVSQLNTDLKSNVILFRNYKLR